MDTSPISNGRPSSRRIHIHRRRSGAEEDFRRYEGNFIPAIVCAVLFVAAVLVDMVYPRTLSHGRVKALAQRLRERNESEVKNGITIADLAAIGIPQKHFIQSQNPYTFLVGSPPVAATALLIYFTPVESLTLVTYPTSPSAIIYPATPARTAHHPVSNPLNLACLPASAARPDGLSRLPFTLHAAHAPATALLHEDGPLLIHHVLNAFRQSLLTADPTHITTATSRYTHEVFYYLLREPLAPIHVIGSPFEIFLRSARAIAAEARRRSSDKSKQFTGSPQK